MAGSATGSGSIFEFNGHYYEAVRLDVGILLIIQQEETMPQYPPSFSK